ncbi:MAG: hypothetical protein MK214_17365 [Thalassotalea sp.]|nr:hypothetical protein [Thalassotalea sp.]
MLFLPIGIFSLASPTIVSAEQVDKEAKSEPIGKTEISAKNSVFPLHWRLERSKENLKIYSAKSDVGSILSIKAELEVESTLSGFLLFLQDTENIPSWLDNANHSQVLSQISQNKNRFVTYFDGVWPVKPRHMVIESEIVQNDDLSIDIFVTDSTFKDDGEKQIAEDRKSIKITVHRAHWHISPIAKENHNATSQATPQNTRLLIAYQFQADPNGALPSWLVNRMTVSSIFTTMNNLAYLLPLSEWQQYQIPHINEP